MAVHDYIDVYCTCTEFVPEYSIPKVVYLKKQFY